MNDKLSNILKKIDEMRGELHSVIEEKGIYNDEVIEISRKVDDLLNEYQKILKDN